MLASTTRFTLAIVLSGLAFMTFAQQTPHPSAPVAAQMRESAASFLAVLPETLRRQAVRPFDDRDRVDWNYTPRSRNGVPLKDLDARGRAAAHALLKTALSVPGYRKAVNIIELELVLREMEAFGFTRDPERYHVTIYGSPDRKDKWGWRFEGHHLSLNFTLAGERMVVGTPSFFGANPATVPEGPNKGLSPLREEHDSGWALLESLTEAQRGEAVLSGRTYGDIVSGTREWAQPLNGGIPAARLDEHQRALLWSIVETYAASFEPGLAKARLARARHGGIESLRFAWAGAVTRGHPHYYRIQGPVILIEYDASQGGGNHIHTVWRDFSGDFGRDLLRDHYATAGGTEHRH